MDTGKDDFYRYVAWTIFLHNIIEPVFKEYAIFAK